MRAQLYGMGAFLFAVALSGCGPQSTAPGSLIPPTFGAEDSVFTDAQLRAAIFSTYEKPEGFYWEDQSGSSPLYINTWCLGLSPVPAWEELGTEDQRQARDWADTTQAHNNPPAPVSNADPTITQRYFEFETIPIAGMGPQKLRVHRASYIDRSHGEQTELTGDMYYGVLQPRPIDSEGVRGIAEYVWFRSSRWMGDVKPLTSFSRTSSSEIVHTIFSAWLIPNGEVGEPARILLIRTDYHVDTQTGAVTISGGTVRSISPRS